ncbi:hypothetical protein SAMN00777080_3265 [Aquiflexum balticum DSM 16537]|uniref:NigD-like protein n=1 Tax=Aquiflexum balticum DSM 16537 TaxID=758820 RepID=A0A1W2H6Q9_9BACT|nr:hypothetical protein [Aquiflexum balticum]SMD44640.1 hypothetical protein SAMN00777080_3265 [Aquiflexum balticum DSM 16537]
MSDVIKYPVFIFLISILGSCISPPDNFPSVPEISFKDIRFVPTDGSDSLIVSVDFKDAEGDLGLNPTDISPPFQPVDFIRDNLGRLIVYSARPPEAPSFNPIDWEINPIVNNQRVMDTVWVRQNPNHNNIFVRFFIKRNGVFQEFKWEDPPFFTTFNGRFPRIVNGVEEQPVEGSIEYAMMSFGWNSIFRNDTIRIEIEIQDRALNRSNMTASPEITLNQIRNP